MCAKKVETVLNLKSSIKPYKKEALKAAKELRYPDSVKKDIENAKTEYEISRIMKNYRLKEE